MHNLFFDGASRGNPGPASYGASLQTLEGKELFSVKGKLGITTNNVAEYTACIQGMILALKHDVKQLCIYGDSKLLVQQVNGAWRVNSENIKPLYKKILSLIPHFSHVQFKHVRRKFNKRADELANEALDELS